MTDERAHGVFLAGADIGTLVQRGDATRFVFRDGYWGDPNRQVLGVWFEDNPHASPRASLRLPAWFSNLLPEGRLRDWVARERGVSSERELQILLQIGRDLPGAVEIRPDVGDPSLVHLLSESAQAERQIDEVDGALLKFSLAGVGMKFSMVREGDRLTLPAGNALGDWIVKLPDLSFPRLVENEYCMMQIAGAVGIEVPEIELVHRDQIQSIPEGLWPAGEDRAYAIRRFDRGVGGSRIHIEDFAQVRGWYSQQKYDGSFATVGALAYRGYDRQSLRQFVKRMTLNLLIGNGDAHLKNWSFIYPDGRIPTLSPAYDIVSTAPYYADTSPEDLGLKFGGTRSFSSVSRSNFDYLQRKLQVSSEDVLDVVDDTLEQFFEVWGSGSGSELSDEMRAWISRHSAGMRRRLSLGKAA